MSELRFFSLAQAKHLEISWPDLYFTPHYGAAVEASDSARWEVAVWSDGPILYPYLKRPIDPSLAGEGMFDIVSPYGYAGTTAPTDVTEHSWREFRTTLRTELRERGCIAEFQRLSNLVPGRAALLDADDTLGGRHHNDTISINLSCGYEELWKAAEGRSRTKTRKGRRLGYEWSCRAATDADVAEGSVFRNLYESTMRHADAASYYFFPNDYYTALQQELGNRLHLLEVRNASGITAVAGLFMEWQPLLHLHLMGSLPEATREGAGNVAYDGLIEWVCRQQRFEKLHIGGGIKSNDGMFYFKRSFGGDLEPFWTARGIIDPVRYEQLAKAAALRLELSVDELQAANYFPCYRAVSNRCEAAAA